MMLLSIHLSFPPSENLDPSKRLIFQDHKVAPEEFSKSWLRTDLSIAIYSMELNKQHMLTKLQI